MSTTTKQVVKTEQEVIFAITPLVDFGKFKKGIKYKFNGVVVKMPDGAEVKFLDDAYLSNMINEASFKDLAKIEQVQSAKTEETDLVPTGNIAPISRKQLKNNK